MSNRTSAKPAGLPGRATALKAALAVVAFALALPGQAATASAGFSVTASLTSACQITSGPTNVAFTYTSFQGTAASSTGGAFSVQCTTNLPYSLSVSAAGGTVVGLAYTLSVPSTTFTGTGLVVNHTISGTMAAGQAGTCASSAAPCTGSNSHTVTVTY